MRIVREIIKLEEVEHEFFDIGEDLDDLSLIRISMIKDVHYNSFDLECLILRSSGSILHIHQSKAKTYPGKRKAPVVMCF